MKKILFIIVVFIFNISFIYASSINDLYNRLYELEEAKELYFGMSFEDVYEVEKKIYEIDLFIDSLYNKVNEINNEIDEYQKEIVEINEQVNNIMTFYQVFDDDNEYLKYLMNSSDYVDLVYRETAIKQIINYYDRLISLLNDKMKKLDDKLKEANDEILEIQKEREKYKRLELVIKGSGNSYGGLETSIDDDINSLLEEINLYKSLGCNNNESLSFCLSIYNDNDLTYPLQRGCVSKDYMALEHKGIDLACNKEGNNVYSAGNGIVSRIVRESTCGGNIVFIYHNVKGKEYTTIYAHLLRVNVYVGQVVDKDTIIGMVGGDSTAYINGWYDDSDNSRWEAHGDTLEDDHIELVDAGTYEDVLAVKAAHDKLKGIVIVKYVNSDGVEIIPSIETTDIVGKEYETNKKEFDGYTFITVEGNETGVYTEETIIVTYYYDKNIGNGDIEPPKTGIDLGNINANNNIEIILYKKEEE